MNILKIDGPMMKKLLFQLMPLLVKYLTTLSGKKATDFVDNFSDKFGNFYFAQRTMRSQSKH